jgi:peptide-methionine (S)-S-oxide reductase
MRVLLKTINSAMLLIAFSALASCSPSVGAEPRGIANQGPEAKTQSQKGEKKMEKAMFGAGCFWGVEVAFRNTRGVTDTAVGYSGGYTENPSYREVCSDKTGHAEVVYVEYDPEQVSYDELLNVFWDSHDPTQLNRQGPDYGSQYRSVIFCYSPEQEQIAKRSKEKLQESGKYAKPIVTEISPAKTFWRAEEYHQRYLEKRGLASCRL